MRMTHVTFVRAIARIAKSYCSNVCPLVPSRCIIYEEFGHGKTIEIINHVCFVQECIE